MKNTIYFIVLFGIVLLSLVAQPAVARLHAQSRTSIDEPIRRAKEMHPLSDPSGSAAVGDFIQECSIKLTNFSFPDGYQLQPSDQIQVFKTTSADRSVGIGLAVLETTGVSSTRIHYYVSSKIHCPHRCDVAYASISNTTENNVLEATRGCELQTTDLRTLQSLTASRQEGVINWVAIGGGLDKEIMEAIVRQRPTYLRLFLATGDFFGIPTHDFVVLTMHDASGNSLNKTADGSDIYYVMGDNFNDVDGLTANISTSGAWPPVPIN